MNQILSTEMPQNNDNNDYKNFNNYKNNGPVNIKKVIIFFGIAIIIFGIIIIAMNLIKGKDNEDVPTEGVAEPQVVIEEIDNSIGITATCDLGISQLEYYFNDEDITSISANGKTNIEKLIDKPRNATKLTVKLKDMNQKETEFVKEFNSPDTTKPTITTEVVAFELGAKLKIIAKDDVEMNYLKYKWTDGEEITIEATGEDKTVIQTEMDIERATKDITITAMDSFENTEIITKTIVGKYNPEISVIQYGNKVECKISHDKGFKKIIFNINGNEMVYDENKSVYDPNLTTFECSIELKEGENKLIIQAYSLEETQMEYKGKCVYNPES